LSLEISRKDAKIETQRNNEEYFFENSQFMNIFTIYDRSFFFAYQRQKNSTLTFNFCHFLVDKFHPFL